VAYIRLTCIHASSSPSTASVIKARSARSPGDPSLSGRSQGSCGEGKLQLPTLNPLLSLAPRFGKCGLVSGSSRRPRSLALQPHSHLVMARAAASPLLRRLHPPLNRACPHRRCKKMQEIFFHTRENANLKLPPSGLCSIQFASIYHCNLQKPKGKILVCLSLMLPAASQGMLARLGRETAKCSLKWGLPPAFQARRMAQPTPRAAAAGATMRSPEAVMTESAHAMLDKVRRK
jgi:hypothetical protein